MRWIILTMLLALSIATATAKDELNPPVPTRDLLHAYDLSTEEKRLIFEALILGIVQGIIVANQALNYRKQPPLYCQPDIGITKSQMIDMMRKAVREKPTLGNYRPAVVVLVVLQDTFPCKE